MKTTTAHEVQEQPLLDAARAVERFWFQPIDPTTLGLIRIATGLVVLYVHLVYCVGLMDYFGPDAWIVNTGLTSKPRPGQEGVTDYMRHDFPFEAPRSSWNDLDRELIRGAAYWSIYFHVEDRFWVWTIHSTVLLIMVLFTLGLWTRVTSVLAWMASIQYIQRLQGMLFGLDTMTNLGLFYLMIAPCGAALSLDRWLKVRGERKRLGAAYVPRPPEPLVSANFAMRALQINYCLIYLGAGTSKLLGGSWWNGTAPGRFLLNFSFAPFEVGAYTWLLKELVKHRWMWEMFCTFGVIFTLTVELGFPFLVWNRRTRWVMVCGSMLLHTMIALLMGLVTFSLMMLALVLCFVPPEAVHQGIHGLNEQFKSIWRFLFPKAFAEPVGGTV